MLAGARGLAGTVVAVIGSLWRARQNRFVTTYGSSRWASRKEAERAGLFEPRGVFLGRLKRDYLRPDGPDPVMAFAPARSGKGVGLGGRKHTRPNHSHKCAPRKPSPSC